MQYDVEGILDSVVEETFPDFSYRANQRETIIRILDAFINKNKKTVLLNAPTGAGKSWISRIVAEVINQLFETDSLFITKTIALQQQYLRDFKDMKQLMGATNYSCHTDLTLPIPPKKKHHPTCRYRKTDGCCEYAAARNAWKDSPLKNLNYAFFFTADGKYTAEGLLVADEAHTLPGSLIDRSEVTINISRLMDLTPEFDMGDYIPVAEIQRTKHFKINYIFDLLPYLTQAKSVLYAQIRDLEKAIEKFDAIGNKAQVESLIASKLGPLESRASLASETVSGINTIIATDPDQWVLYEDTGERDLMFKFKPLEVLDSSASLIMHPEYRLLMTATPFNLIYDLKLSMDDTEVITTDYAWPLENRPFIVERSLPSMNFKTKADVFPEYVEALDNFLEGLGDDTTCGLVHSASYANAEEIKKLSKYADRMYIPTSKEVRDITKLMTPGRIIVSPSILEGVDLPGDLARFQVFFKLSWPNLGDIWVERKKVRDPSWYSIQTAIAVIQGSGRAIRSESDFAITYMMDPSFDRLIKDLGTSIPDWFLSTLV